MSPGMGRHTATMLGIAAAIAVAAGGCRKTPPPAAAAQPPEVYVTPVVQKDVPVYLELVGQTEGFQDVDIRARVEGFLDTVVFREGSFVRKGELLYRIDPEPFQVALAGANADMATAEARLEKTNNDVKRYAPLAAQQAVSQQELDNALAAQDAARAQVAAAKATVDKATLDLGYTRVRSPIDGLVGTTQVKAGNLVGRGESTLLTTVSQIDPILFRVGVTEAEYLRLAREYAGQPGRAERIGGIQLTLADETVYPFAGRVHAVERAVNPTTGTLGAQLVFPNPQRTLRPGQYGRARVLVEMKRNALLVPQRAVQELQNLYSVAVVGPDDKVAFRNVTVGPRVGSLWVVEQGLQPGQRVVAEGLQAIGDGMAVRTKAIALPGEAGEAEAVETTGVAP